MLQLDEKRERVTRKKRSKQKEFHYCGVGLAGRRVPMVSVMIFMIASFSCWNFGCTNALINE
jgi:hypothetical protein